MKITFKKIFLRNVQLYIKKHYFFKNKKQSLTCYFFKCKQKMKHYFVCCFIYTKIDFTNSFIQPSIIHKVKPVSLICYKGCRQAQKLLFLVAIKL